MMHTTRTKAPTMLALAAASALVLAGCAGGDEQTDAGEGIQGSPDTATAQPTQTGDQSDAAPDSGQGADEGDFNERDVRSQSFDVDHERAVEIALDEAGGGFVYKLEIDWSDRNAAWVYEVEVLEGTTEHEFDLDAQTGEVLKHERDTDDDDEREIMFSMLPAEALEIAAAELTDGEWIEGWTLSWDDGVLEYEIDTEGGGDDIHIDVESGAVTRD